MLTVLGNWIYILFTTFCIGSGFSWLSERCTGYRLKRADSVLTAGLIGATVYAEAFSLFYRVGAEANLALTVFCLLLAFFLRRRMLSDIRRFYRGCSVLRRGVIAALFVVWIYLTCQGYMHYDTDLYHAQSIRWVEEYGAVKGLANLHFRFAYNSSLFPVTALYSFRFLLGQSLHTVDGWAAFLLSLTVLDAGLAWRRKKLLLSDYACIAAAYYLTLIADEIVSPASDYITMCMVFYIVIKWVRQNEEDSRCIAPYGLLCVAGVYAVSLKLSAGLILLLLIKPAYLLLRERRWKQTGFYLLCGALTAAPWLARNVVLSGWLVYPVTAIDLFAVDWKLPAWEVQLDAAEIKTWGRALYNASMTDVPVKDWFGNWFRTSLSRTEKLLVLGNAAALVAYPATALWAFRKRKKERYDHLLVMGALHASYVFWQLSAPLIRYGYAYVLLTVFLFGGRLLQKLPKDRLLQAALLLFGIYKLYAVGLYMYVGLSNPFLVWQQDYNSYELRSYKIKGQEFYAPKKNSELTGYDPFPATAKKVKNVRLRGESLSDGFKRKK